MKRVVRTTRSIDGWFGTVILSLCRRCHNKVYCEGDTFTFITLKTVTAAKPQTIRFAYCTLLWERLTELLKSPNGM